MSVQEELERLRLLHGGVLMPELVVNAARYKSSPLHESFDWDDGEAAHKWRLEQARRLIRVYVPVIDANGPKEIRGYVSLSPDRMGEGGYRAMVDVLKNEDMREQLLADALDDLRRIKMKYAALNEVAAVFAAINAIKIRRPQAVP